MFKVFIVRMCSVMMFFSLLACGQENIVDSFKASVLDDHPSTTIGKAFDMYQGFSNITWIYEQLPNGTNVVSIRGEVPREKWLNQSSSFAGFNIPAITTAIIEFSFIIPPDGEFYLDSSSVTFSGDNLQEIEAMHSQLPANIARMTRGGCQLVLTDDAMIDQVFNAVYSNKAMGF